MCQKLENRFLLLLDNHIKMLESHQHHMLELVKLVKLAKLQLSRQEAAIAHPSRVFHQSHFFLLEFKTKATANFKIGLKTTL